jgi:hypothetical protein
MPATLCMSSCVDLVGGLLTASDIRGRLHKHVKPAAGTRQGADFAAAGVQLDELLYSECGLEYPLQGWDRDWSKNQMEVLGEGQLWWASSMSQPPVLCWHQCSTQSSRQPFSTHRVYGRPSKVPAVQSSCTSKCCSTRPVTDSKIDGGGVW